MLYFSKLKQDWKRKWYWWMEIRMKGGTLYVLEFVFRSHTVVLCHNKNSFTWAEPNAILLFSEKLAASIRACTNLQREDLLGTSPTGCHIKKSYHRASRRANRWLSRLWLGTEGRTEEEKILKFLSTSSRLDPIVYSQEVWFACSPLTRKTMCVFGGSRRRNK